MLFRSDGDNSDVRESLESSRLQPIPVVSLASSKALAVTAGAKKRDPLVQGDVSLDRDFSSVTLNDDLTQRNHFLLTLPGRLNRFIHRIKAFL